MNNIQSEAQLENNLVKQLTDLQYDFIKIADEKELLINLKNQIEIHNFKTLNGRTFSDDEFDRILNHLDKWNVFDRAKTLRDKMSLELDNWEKVWIEFIDSNHWCQNEFQVSNQITMEWSYKNRYDVTILINGLPLIQIELKRRWLELKEAFNQTNRYHKHSYWAGKSIFQYIQIFIISNGVNTKYYANNKNQSFKQTFFWANKKNENITKLEDFTSDFLEPCHIAKIITKYIVLNETDKILMVLRPYQYYAVEAIIDRVKNTDKNGYIWHTTWSWKTLTSFKASQILTKLPEVKKVVFVVDRKDLDYQTTKEFNSFSKGSIDGTDNTKQLVKQFENDTPLIVTTIQKLNTAISKERYLQKMEKLRDEKIVFIFDEAHRSQFWETHRRITKFFNNHQMFGFTGTPIFAKNNNNKKTTKDLFDEQLHTYVITDAIKDENVLRFSIEYIGKYKEKSNTNLDIKVEDIDTKELLEDPVRLEKISDYIIKNHDYKTHSKYFTSMFCVSSIDSLIKYYEIFKKKEHNLKIATIFSYWTNEEDKDADGIIDEINFDVKEINTHSRDKLESFIGDYNDTFWTKFTTKDTQSYYNYYNDISKKVKERQIDILLVVNMFLTWFDSKTLNTLYVDKNLKYHWLIQAFSRTNRILNEQKSQWNIVCFRNLKKATDEAIGLFSNPEAKEVIIMDSFETYVSRFNEALAKMRELANVPSDVDLLVSEHEQFDFIKAFREIIRLKNVLETFVDFSFDTLDIDAQTFEDYKSKYLDIHDNVKSKKDKVSILDDVDFELELIARDDINIDYIIALLANLVDSDDTQKEKQKKAILDTVAWDVRLRSKRELIEKFIDEHVRNIKDSSNVNDEFEKFFNNEKIRVFKEFCEEEKLDKDKFEILINDYLYSEKMPLMEDIASTLSYKPKLLERKNVIEGIKERMMKFLEIFE